MVVSIILRNVISLYDVHTVLLLEHKLKVKMLLLSHFKRCIAYVQVFREEERVWIKKENPISCKFDMPTEPFLVFYHTKRTNLSSRRLLSDLTLRPGQEFMYTCKGKIFTDWAGVIQEHSPPTTSQAVYLCVKCLFWVYCTLFCKSVNSNSQPELHCSYQTI